MKTFHKKRLLKLAAHLRTVPREEFDIRVMIRKTTCGTVACAMGHAPSIPSFRRAGLVVDMFPNHSRGLIKYNGKFGFSAAEEFFGLSPDEADSLFTASGYRNRNPLPSTVANRLEKLVATKGRPQ